MSNIDLQGMINQLMGITKEAWDLKKRKLDEGLSGHDQTEARNYEIQKEQNKNVAAQTLQAQSNEAALTQAKERTAGEIARQGMANEASRYTADQGLQGHKYTADLGLQGHKYTADKTLEGTKTRIGSLEGTIEAVIKGNPSMTADQIVELRQKLYDQSSMNTPQAGTPAPQARPTLTDAAVPAVTAKRPTPTYDDGKDIKTPSIFDTQKNSMDFVSPVLREAQNAPPPKSLQQQDADYFNRNKSAAGVVINPMLSPGESARMRMGQDKINAAPKETEEERKKRQEQNRFRAGLS